MLVLKGLVEKTVETVSDFILGGSKITADSDCNHEIKRCLVLGRKAMANLLLLLLSCFSHVRLCATPETAAHQAPPSLGWEDPLEKGMATHSSTLAWRIPWTEEPGGIQSMRLQRVGHDLVTKQ